MSEAEAAGTAPAAVIATAEPTAEAGRALHAPAACYAADTADPESPREDADARSAAAPDSFSASNSPCPSHQSDPGAPIDAVERSGTEAVDTADEAPPKTAAATDRAQADMPGGADKVLSSFSSSQSPPASAESRHGANAPRVISPQTKANAAALQQRPGKAADSADFSFTMADTGHGRRELRAAAGLMQLLKELVLAGTGKAVSSKERRTPSEAQVLLLSPR